MATPRIYLERVPSKIKCKPLVARDKSSLNSYLLKSFLRSYMTLCLFSIPQKKIGLKVVHSNIDHFTIEGKFMIYLFYLIHQNI